MKEINPKRKVYLYCKFGCKVERGGMIRHFQVFHPRYKVVFKRETND
jgi:hypothetical protein